MALRIVSAVPVLVVLVGWALGSAILGADVVPSPAVVAFALVGQLGTTECWRAVGGTTGRMLLSFAAAAVLGVSVGVFLGRQGPLRRGAEAVIDFLRSIPGPALLPIFMTLFGLYAGPKIALAVFVCSLINAVYTGTGIRLAARSLRVTMARSFGATRWFIFWKVVLPAALELIVAGLRVTLSLALVLAVLAELVLMTGEGIGVLIRIGYEDRKIPEMYALMVLSGCIGTFLNSAFLAVERRTAWYRRDALAASSSGTPEFL